MLPNKGIDELLKSCTQGAIARNETKLSQSIKYCKCFKTYQCQPPKTSLNGNILSTLSNFDNIGHHLKRLRMTNVFER